MISLTQSDRRAVLAAVLVIAAAAVYTRVLPRYRAFETRQLGVARQSMLDVATLHESMDGPGRLTEHLSHLRATADTLDSWVMRPETAASGWLTLTRLVTDAGDAYGVELTSLAQQPDSKGSDRSAYHRLRVRAAFAADFKSLSFFLATLESRRPRLVVRQLVLSQPENGAGPGALLRGEVVVECLAVIGSPGRS